MWTRHRSHGLLASKVSLYIFVKWNVDAKTEGSVLTWFDGPLWKCTIHWSLWGCQGGYRREKSPSQDKVVVSETAQESWEQYHRVFNIHKQMGHQLIVPSKINHALWCNPPCWSPLPPPHHHPIGWRLFVFSIRIKFDEGSNHSTENASDIAEQ